METDMSTAMTLKATDLLRRSRDRVRDMMPYGPMRKHLTPKEALAQLAAMSPDDRTLLAQQVGVDQFLATVQELQRKAQGGA